MRYCKSFGFHRRRKSNWLAFGLLFVLCVLAIRYYRRSQHISLRFSQKIDQYCNHPDKPLYGEEGPSGRNGLSEIAELVQVHVIHRHGDRSPIYPNPIPEIGPAPFECTMTDTTSPTNHGLLNQFFEFSPNFIASNGRRHHDIITKSKLCNNGQLTTEGFLQHFQLGMHLKRSYQDFTNGVNVPFDLLVKSTNYNRTVQSVSALLFGMFEESLKDSLVKINIINDYILGAHFLIDGEDQPIKCDAITAYERRSKQAGVIPVKLRKKIQEYYHLQPRNIPSMGTMADLVYTRQCHQFPLTPGANGQLSTEDKLELLLAADEFTVNKFSFLEDFQALALISQVIHQCYRLVVEEIIKAPRFIFYSGHDSVLTPMLLSLGISNGKWPPYASRMVIEFWRTTPDKNSVIKFDNFIMDDLSPKLAGVYFRIIYNGETLTHKVTICEERLFHNDELCPAILLFSFAMGNEAMELDFFTKIKKKCQS